MDATANDVPANYQVRGFPTIYFAPKGKKQNPKKYEVSVQESVCTSIHINIYVR